MFMKKYIIYNLGKRLRASFRQISSKSKLNQVKCLFKGNTHNIYFSTKDFF